jgi:two-component SAPR family response regulator
MQETSVDYSTVDKQPKKSSLTSKARIFLVEDELLVLEDLKERLLQQNYEVAGTATSGYDAIDNIVSCDPDLVIIDIRIEGELNGIEVAIIIQSHFDYFVPVIFLTGFSEQVFPYLKVLPDYIYLNKPYQDTILFDAIERALKTTRQERAS